MRKRNLMVLVIALCLSLIACGKKDDLTTEANESVMEVQTGEDLTEGTQEEVPTTEEPTTEEPTTEEPTTEEPTTEELTTEEPTTEGPTTGEPTTEEPTTEEPTPPETEHVHSWNEATCTAPKTCASCGVTEGEILAHQAGEWITDTEKNVTYQACINCGARLAEQQIPDSEGLAYEVNADGVTCTITGIGTCADTYVRIPSHIDGYEVIRIGVNAFDNCNLPALTGVKLPDTVTEIAERAFGSCQFLEEIVVSANLTTIGDNAFMGCYSLVGFAFPDSVTYVGVGAFSSCFSLNGIVWPSQITQIGEQMFSSCWG